MNFTAKKDEAATTTCIQL